MFVDIQFDGVIIEDGFYPSTFIQNKGRNFRIGSESLSDLVKNPKYETELGWVDDYFFHYVADDLIEKGNKENIIKQIEADDIPRSEW